VASGWSHAHGKTGAELVPSTWQPTTRSKLAAAVRTRLVVAALTGYQLPDGHLKGLGEIEEPLVQQTPSALLDVDQNVAGDT
jgi:hypothetical protein